MLSIHYQLGIIFVILHISLSHSTVAIVDDTQVNVNCNLSNPVNFPNEIDNIFRNLSSNITKLTINCRGGNLSLNPKSFAPNLSLQYLHFNGLSIDILPNSFKNLYHLTYLGFSNCDLTKITTTPFGRLHNAIYLNLSSNAIIDFSDLLFPISSKFSHVNLSSNRISFFPDDVSDNLLKFVDVFDIRNNTLACNCSHQWIYRQKFDNKRWKIDLNPLLGCDNNQDLIYRNRSFWDICEENRSSITVIAYSFENIVLDCPPNTSFSHWISPHDGRFGFGDLNRSQLLSHAKFFIQPLFAETVISVNKTTNSLLIMNFRGYFRGDWVCIARDGSVARTVTLVIRVHTKQMFDLSIAIAFSFAGSWLFVAICVGLFQYCRETACCRHKIDYNKSNLFEKRYVQTVIPVPFVDSVSDSSSNDSDVNCSKPLNRTRYDSHNNDVQLIFKDRELADEYAEMLSQLKEASETGDEHFKDRLTTLRTRFSIDFNKMRFELKRGMESLKSNSSAAAHKLRKSVGHMKDHMKSFSEFCGTSSTMAQSISIVVISPDNQHGNEPGRSGGPYVGHEKKVFHFFEPI